MQPEDCYDTLGLLPGAEDALVKAAHRALMWGSHTDVVATSDDNAKALNRAYTLLSDAEKRLEHDEKLESSFPGAPKTMSEARIRLSAAEAELRAANGETLAAREEVDRLRRRMDSERRQRESAERGIQQYSQNCKHLTLNAQVARRQAQKVESQLEQARVSLEQADEAKKLSDRTAERLRLDLGTALYEISRSKPGRARWLLSLFFLGSGVISAFVGLWFGSLVAMSAQSFSSEASTWPELLRNPTVAVSCPAAVMIVLLIMMLIPLKKESLWLLAGPSVALMGIWVSRSPNVSQHLWTDAERHLTWWLFSYLAFLLSVWTLNAVARPLFKREP